MSDGTKWSDLRLRLMSAALIVPVALFCIWRGGLLYDAMILLVVLGMTHEALNLTRGALSRWRAGLFHAWPLAALAAAFKGAWGPAIWIAGVGFVFGPARWAALAVVIAGGLSLVWLRHLPEVGLASVLFVIVVVMVSDTGAYATGRIFGGPKLAPRISPGKTRSGAIGGLVCAALAGGAMARLAAPWDWVGGLVWGAVLGIAAQAGDLAESAAKRQAGVKDSGSLIPGHGGLLDRFDALLVAGPLAALVSLAVAGRPFWSAGLGDLARSLFSSPAGLG
ncbi:phosphatidate cytidylyltransferase [Acidomonas methanolica]|uniref:Phosphatidate cytidylyltransferase n=2 Tax=Acidomonas methanolica TaxID=437 RepID=A0A023D9Y0_ACIMT|nr:phosphatidate cytidylyltransferase [Acidomonas methanolica]MBU2653882.1 phosphatidate cytidylyltransferase [Acidomonas methanolica]TCS30842.1 phosphatidate cytidylyltransferase [Acidomonas methanolica]GAJ30626.1 phosphatidate cytidylyltransferase [Acidomonas methanolica NBRC 104435]GEK98361.1 phosphatidate cytidylyltransferase [Acidomonas methanolica NBRC 104435]